MNDLRPEARNMGKVDMPPFGGRFEAEWGDLFTPPERGDMDEARKRELTEIFEMFPDEEQVRALELLRALAREMNPPEKPDLSEIKRYPGFRKAGSSIDWLREHYGQWLKAFGAPENLIYRQDIAAHDQPLMTRLSLDAAALGKAPRDYVPTIEDKTIDKAPDLGIDPETGQAVTPDVAAIVNTALTLRAKSNRRRTNQEHLEAPLQPSHQ